MTKIAGVIGTAFVASIGVDTVRAWADATKGALEFAGSLGETAQQIGATTDELQEYRYVASQVGIEQTVMDKGLAKLSITLGNMAADVGSTAEKLEQFGFTQEEVARISQLTAGEALPFLAAKYEALSSPTEKAALAAAFFGAKMGGQFIPLLNEGAAGLQKMRDAAHELGIVISEQAIANADANADLISTYEQIATAQKNAALTVPENVRAYVEYEKTVNELTLTFYKAIASLNEFNEWSKTVNQSLRDFGKNTGIQAFFAAQEVSLASIANAWSAMGDAISSAVTKIRSLVGGMLRSVWDGAINKIGELGEKFRWLYDVVVGHSYVPDMVDGIAAQMARLDSVMVTPAGKATTATAKKFQDLRDLLDRLFPDAGRRTNFANDMALIANSGLSEAEQAAAFARLQRERAGVDVVQGAGKTGPDFGNDGGPLVEATNAASDAIDRLAERSKIGTVRIAKSFADMATSTLQSLQSLTNAIKGGGFLDILTAVAGLAIQLGQGGAFGSKIAGFLNKPPAYASGTNFHPGGLALVGERGPELVSMPRGSRVTPNSAMGGVTNNYYTLPSDEFWGRINAGHAAAASAGARGGVARVQRMNERALA